MYAYVSTYFKLHTQLRMYVAKFTQGSYKFICMYVYDLQVNESAVQKLTEQFVATKLSEPIKVSYCRMSSVVQCYIRTYIAYYVNTAWTFQSLHNTLT